MSRHWSEHSPSLLCRLFGHGVPDGYGTDAPYGSLIGGARDGIGREHWSVRVNCPRCGDRYVLAKLHGPLPQLKAGDIKDA
jgi:hypothetical protein